MKTIKLIFAFALLYSNVVCSQKQADNQYQTVEVDAPFPMENIKIFIFPGKDFNINDYGAIAGNKANNTKAIAKAIKACNHAGGGRVVVPAGEWLTGPIHFRSNVNLHLEENAVLRFTDNPGDYLPAVMISWEGMECYNYSPLVYAFGCENIAITGKGTLSPQMDTWKKWFGRPQAHLNALKELYTKASMDVPVEQRQMAKGENNLRPHLVHFNRCRNVLLDGFRIRESPFWTIHIYMCDGGIARNLDVKAHGHNNDGIDLEMTRNFLVENCIFDQGDDAVVIKSGRNRDAWRLNTPAENIVVRNCNVVNGHTLLGVGSEISAGVRNVYMHNCSAADVRRFFFIKTNHRRGGFVENIYMENVTAGKTQRVFEIDTDVLYQWRDLVPTYETRYTKIENIHLKNMICTETDAIYELKGDKNLPVRNVEIQNVHAGKVNKFIRKAENTGNIVEENVTHGERLIHNGVPWFDDNGNIVNAHGACIVKDGGKYYLFGEYKTDSINKFIGFSCYSSPDLVNWTFERMVLPVQKDGLLGPNRIGERVKVMRCPSTGEYVMYMHADDMKYNDPHVGYATSKTINGDYEFQGALLFDGKPIRRWDMGTFQDSDGKGYLLIHHGDIYRLGDDYRSAKAKVAERIPGSGESPAMFKKNGLYYLLYSSLTSWERNDNFYYTAPSIEGPWEKQGLFCPEGSLTYNSQCSFVLPLVRGNDTIPVYMGDRWSFPRQGEAATHVWLPMQTDGTKLSVPEYWPSWDFHTLQPVIRQKKPLSLPDDKPFVSNRKGDTVQVTFNGSQIALIGETTPHGGYARVTITGKQRKIVCSSVVDFYSKVPDNGLRFISPKLPLDDYTLTVEVIGEQGVWYNKKGDRFGSNDYFVILNCIEYE
ncbi:MAG: glycosyl hydrolase family 28 protein [Breznakibacter sp.]